MINQNYDILLKSISEKSNLSQEEVETKIFSKLKELQDLISREGAAHIVANELGVKLITNEPQNLKIDKVSAGIPSIILTAKVLQIYETREFIRNDKKSKVASILVGDETGTIRIVIWDENLINQISDLKENDIIKVKNSYSRENRGYKELHLGQKSQLQINPEGETIEDVKRVDISRQTSRKEIVDLKEGEFAEILGYVVQVYEPRYYSACPQCNRKVNEGTCDQHGQVEAKQVPILNMFIDDGTNSIRVVCFRDQADKIISNRDYENLKNEVMGKQFLIKGKANKNQMFDRLEFAVNSIEEPSIEELLAEK